MERSYVDVNVFVYWLGGHPAYGLRAKEWINAIASAPRGSFVTSSLTVYEAAVILAGLVGTSLKNALFVEKIIEAFGELAGLLLVELEGRDFTEALKLMKEHRMDFEDALHLAVARRIGATRIISNDLDFDNAPLARVF